MKIATLQGQQTFNEMKFMRELCAIVDETYRLCRDFALNLHSLHLAIIFCFAYCMSISKKTRFMV